MELLSLEDLLHRRKEPFLKSKVASRDLKISPTSDKEVHVANMMLVHEMTVWTIFDAYDFTFCINKVLICFGRDLHSIPETSNLAIFSIYSLDFNFGNSSVNIDFDSR